MRSGLALRWIFGVRIRLHYTSIVAFILGIAIVVTQFPEAYPLWHRVIFGIAGSLIFFMSLGLRELALNFLAISKGVPIKRVTLFIFGGIPQISSEATSPGLDLLVAVAGLVSNLVIASVLYGAHLIFVKTGNVIFAGLTQWLAFMYFMLALFHFVPGFPLDGGRILRALLWKVTDNYNRVTRISSWIGCGIGLLFIIGGILLLIATLQWFNGLTLTFIGWVLLSAASQSRRQAIIHEALHNITAGDIMNPEFPLINQQLNLEQLIQERIIGRAQRYFIVADGPKLQGVVTLRDIKPIPRNRWNSTRVGEIMTPASELKTAHPQQSAATLLEQMDDFEINNMPVLEEGEVIGIVARESLIHLARVRTELKI